MCANTDQPQHMCVLVFGTVMVLRSSHSTVGYYWVRGDSQRDPPASLSLVTSRFIRVILV